MSSGLGARKANAKAVAVAALIVLDVALVVLLLMRNAHPGGGAAAPAAASSSNGAGSPSTGPASATPSTGSAPATPSSRLTLRLATTASAPQQPVAVSGRYAGAAPGTSLLLERRGAGGWQPFPVPASTRGGGGFHSVVQLMKPGRYQLRVRDPVGGVISDVVTLQVR